MIYNNLEKIIGYLYVQMILLILLTKQMMSKNKKKIRLFIV